MSIELIDFYKTTFEPLKLRTRTPNTKKLYDLTLRQYAEFLGRSPTIDDLTDDSVGAFLNWFRSSGRSPATTNKNRANLLALWRYAARKGLTTRWPDVSPDPEPIRIPVAWTRENLSKLFDGLSQLEGTTCGIPSADWWTSLPPGLLGRWRANLGVAGRHLGRPRHNQSLLANQGRATER